MCASRNNRQQQKTISIIIPVLNEEQNIESTYDRIEKVFNESLKRYNFEVIFTDNNSSDASFAVISRLCDQHNNIKAIRFVRNFGFNKSILTGYRLSTGHAAIQLDCDLQDSPEVFVRFVELWEKGYDCVVGLRNDRPESKIMRSTRNIFYRFLSSISDSTVLINGGDFRLIDGALRDKLRSFRDPKPFVRNLISSISKNEIGVVYSRSGRKFGKSKFSVLKLIPFAFDGLISSSILPLRLATIIGATVALFTMVLGVLILSQKIINPSAIPSGYTMSILLDLLAISINALFLGIIGEYVGRIYLAQKAGLFIVVEKSKNCSNDEIESIQKA